MNRAIEIPIQNSDEVLVVDITEDFGANTQESDSILEILTSERAPIHLYLEFAREFHKRGYSDYVEKTLEKGAERGLNESLRDTAYVKILHTLALHFIESAASVKTDNTSGRTPGSRSYLPYLSRATELLNKAENIDNKNVWTAIVRGSLSLASSKLPEAVKSFQYAVNAEGENLAALMGLGAAQFRSHDYKSALKTYQKVLSLFPNMDVPDPRLAIGVCYHRLQMTQHALLAFKRSVEVNPSNPDALSLLARMEWNQAREEGNVQLLEAAVERVKEAFSGVGRKNAAVLNLIGEGLYFRGEFDGVETVSKAAIAATDSNIVKAEAYGAMAKALHSQGKFSSAFEMYSKAASLHSSSLTYQYGLGQMYINQGEHQKALDCFEKVLAKDEENLETLKKVASLCSEHPKLLDKSLGYFGKLQALIKKFNEEEGMETLKKDKDSVGIFPDPIMQMELSKIYETTNPSIALKGYLNALSILEANGAADSAIELLNNIGALYHRDAQSPKDFDLAKNYYERALTAADNVPDLTDKSNLRVTVQYNLARLYEQLGSPTDARSQLSSIVESHPAYFDSYLRLAAMTSNYEDARALIQKGLIVDRRSSLLMLGNSFFDDTSNKANLRDSRKSFEEVLQKADKNDSFALCSVGNIYLVIARFDQKQKEVHVKKALEFFDKAVRVDNKNVFGATGVGICLAELGQFEQAREVFTQVLEGATNMPGVSTNLAHVLVELGQTKLAISHYERVLKKNPEQNVGVLQCLARAYYIVAKTDKDPIAMRKSLVNIQRAIHLDPFRWSLHYDLALVKQQYAQIMNDQPTDKRSVTDLKKSLEGLETSQKIFAVLGDKKESNLGYDVKLAKERAAYCKDLQRVSEKKIHETTVLEEQRKERLLAIKQEQMRIEQAQLEKEREAREKEKRDKEETEAKRREIMAKMAEENKRARERAEQEEEEEARKPSKRKKQDPGSDESDGEGDLGDGDEKEKKKKRKRKEKKRGEGEEEEEEEKQKKPRKLVSKRALAGDEERDGEGGESVPRVGRPSNLSRAVIDSDDDE
ncbi:protein required for normal CLN1 and CLN2 G1 cyclin expression [Rhizoclosmatium hyalinum]|nr:protein required for normal CLN1 and CLN2 G1 cyclin expression [Rhizoclosmatium hyalinum]